MPLLHVRELLSFMAHFTAGEQTLAALHAIIGPFMAR